MSYLNAVKQTSYSKPCCPPVCLLPPSSHPLSRSSLPELLLKLNSTTNLVRTTNELHANAVTQISYGEPCCLPVCPLLPTSSHPSPSAHCPLARHPPKPASSATCAGSDGMTRQANRRHAVSWFDDNEKKLRVRTFVLSKRIKMQQSNIMR